MSSETTKEKLYSIIFGTETLAGRIFDLILIGLILISVLCVMLDSFSLYHEEYSTLLFSIEWFFTIIFTIEYLTRLYCSPNPKAYASSFYGIVDLLAVIPTYLSLIFASTNFLIVVRLLRLLRIFRILKLFNYMNEAHVLMRSILMARRKIYIFLYSISIAVTLYGSLMYVVEGPEYGFDNIPKSIYWAIVTVTTVGYGDITPHTLAGQIIASLAMLTGYAILAVPTGILSAELINEMKKERAVYACRNCERAGHEKDAEYCKFCGTELWFAKKEDD
ncbi:ion transporter [Dasania sp. GY-MA-18]|uniref:Ion transporter n=1 Tax=Dasania phycosphaerae TaxID=2950436 RepID=A0A9J6RQ50_9GAMM|nr:MULTISPECIES: ion transporter [Dasania]MCR8924185.1 ion transporter [Dasania sp. GY-MA-18]MCZ0866838.1 ion transporter [Dasania phycosphaerae]MCZ0870343.1 ion transporter [Dasania phycosphaerae]